MSFFCHFCSVIGSSRTVGQINIIIIIIIICLIVAGQSATIRFGRGRRPRGPTYARGTIRSLFEDQEQATQRTAYDVATRPPCRNLFWGRSFRNNSVCLSVQ
jgi:flagellar basal body-associated protein FliL